MPRIIQSREMGYLERVAAHLEQMTGGCPAPGAMTFVELSITEQIFKDAAQILFRHRPSLQATLSADQSAFLYNAQFSDVEITCVEVENIEAIHTLYTDISAPFNTQKALWRMQLAHLQSQPDQAYIIFGASHAICDGRSIAYLMGDLLTCIKEIQQRKALSIQAHPVAPSLDEALEPSRIRQTAPLAAAASAEPLPALPSFQRNVSVRDSSSKNMLRALQDEQFTLLKILARERKTTITAVLCAALILAINKIYPVLLGAPAHAAIAADLRPHTSGPLTLETLGFYAFNFPFALPNKFPEDIWALAALCKERYSAVLERHRHPPVTEIESNLTSLRAAVKKNLDENRFSFFPTVSNAGPVDRAFSGHPEVRSFAFTLNNRGMLPISIYAAAYGNQLSLTFNYSNPTLSDELVQALADQTLVELKSLRDNTSS